MTFLMEEEGANRFEVASDVNLESIGPDEQIIEELDKIAKPLGLLQGGSGDN